jgi:hypothetical protein
MTLEEAKNLRIFKKICTCGGYTTFNNRDIARPHMDYCPQKNEYNEWFDLVGEEFFKKIRQNR